MKPYKLILVLVCAVIIGAAGFAVYGLNTGTAAVSLSPFPPPYTPSKIAKTAPPPSPTPSPMPTPAPTPAIKTAKLNVTGDLMVHEWQLNFSYDWDLRFYDFDYSFQYVKKYLSDADYTIGNLETTFGGRDKGYTGYPMFSSPDIFGQALKNSGFDFLSTANNHSNDSWEAGILRTLDVLDGLKIDHAGTYRSQTERDTVFIKEINGITFAFLSYTYGTNGLPLTAGKPYLANLLEEALIKSDIQKAKALNPDFIVVLPHMGDEYALSPRQAFKDWVNMMLNAGADIVIASHPHVLQPVEFVTVTNPDGTQRTCFVAYSMGNFISSQRTEPRDAGIILSLYFEKTAGEKAVIKNVSFIPTWVKFVNASGEYDITVLSVYDTLTAHQTGIDVGLKPTDIERLKAVSRETTKMILGREIPLEEIKNEYFLK